MERCFGLADLRNVEADPVNRVRGIYAAAAAVQAMRTRIGLQL